MALRLRLGIATTLFVVLIFTVPAMLFGVGAGAQGAGQDGSSVSITVDATGTVSAPPDLAVINVAVEASDSSADGARAAVTGDVSELRESLTEANVPDDQIRTSHFNIQMVHDEDGTITYRAIHGFVLRVPVDDAGSVVDSAVAGGATRVDGVQFTLAGETSRELRNDALEEALANARTDADVIASATGVEVQSVESVETVDGDVGPVFLESARGGDTAFEPGPVTVSARVTVTYAAR